LSYLSDFYFFNLLSNEFHNLTPSNFIDFLKILMFCGKVEHIKIEKML